MSGMFTFTGIVNSGSAIFIRTIEKLAFVIRFVFICLTEIFVGTLNIIINNNVTCGRKLRTTVAHVCKCKQFLLVVMVGTNVYGLIGPY